MKVYLLFRLNETSWSHSSKTFIGTYLNQDVAREYGVPDWARDKLVKHLALGEESEVARFGADGIYYVIEEHEVQQFESGTEAAAS